MPHKSLIGTRLPAIAQRVISKLHATPKPPIKPNNALSEFRNETQRINDKKIEQATGVPSPVRPKKPKSP